MDLHLPSLSTLAPSLSLVLSLCQGEGVMKQQHVTSSLSNAITGGGGGGVTTSQPKPLDTESPGSSEEGGYVYSLLPLPPTRHSLEHFSIKLFSLSPFVLCVCVQGVPSPGGEQRDSTREGVLPCYDDDGEHRLFLLRPSRTPPPFLSPPPPLSFYFTPVFSLALPFSRPPYLSI
jgi:hypothetical protein